MKKDNTHIGHSINPEPELPQGHKKRFLLKLDTNFHKQQNRIIQFQALTIAASIAITILISIILIVRINSFNQHKAILSNVSDELKETELFYQYQIATGIETLKNSYNVDQELIADLEEMDQNLQNINKELKENPGDARVIQAVLTIYQTKLDLINDVLYRIQ